MDHLDQLEQQSVYIFREAFRHFERLCMLWSIGKDSTVLLWLARKAFFGHVPFPLVHIDTSYKLPEMIAYRDRLALEYKLHDGRRPEHGGAGERRHLPAQAAASPGMSTRRAGQRAPPAAGASRATRSTRPCTGPAPRKRLNLETGQVRDRHRPRALPRRDRGRARRRGGQPLEGALLLAARQEQRLGRRRSAARVLEPVQDRLRAGHARAHPSAARLDRAQHLGVHQAREHPDGVAVLRPGRRARATAASAAAPARRPSRARRRTSTTSSPSSRAAS